MCRADRRPAESQGAGETLTTHLYVCETSRHAGNPGRESVSLSAMNVADELNTLSKAVRHAGQTVLQMARDGFEVARKANEDPVTTADLEADRILKEALLADLPDAGWLSEETRDNPARLACDRVWVVDPIDGTKEFVTGIPEFAVSVALVESRRPVRAAVYNPVREEMFLAARGSGATLND